MPNASKTAVLYNICGDIEGQIGRLIMFFEDNPTNSRTLTYPVVIHYQDSNDWRQDEMVLECITTPEMILKILPKQSRS